MIGEELLEAVVGCGSCYKIQPGKVEYIDSANLRITNDYLEWENHKCDSKEMLILLKCKRCNTNLCFVPPATPPMDNHPIHGNISPQEYFVVEEHIKLCLGVPK